MNPKFIDYLIKPINFRTTCPNCGGKVIRGICEDCGTTVY